MAGLPHASPPAKSPSNQTPACLAPTKKNSRLCATSLAAKTDVHRTERYLMGANTLTLTYLFRMRPQGRFVPAPLGSPRHTPGLRIGRSCKRLRASATSPGWVNRNKQNIYNRGFPWAHNHQGLDQQAQCGVLGDIRKHRPINSTPET